MVAGGIVFLGFSLIAAAFIIMSVRIYQVRPDFMMKVLRYSLIAIFGIVFSIIALAIGFRVSERHSKSYSRNLKSVQEIWGGQIVQESPSFSYPVMREEQYVEEKSGQTRFRLRLVNDAMGFESHDILLKINRNIRTRGLLIFPGFVAEFKGAYELRNLQRDTRRCNFNFPLPSGAGNITGITVELDGKPYKGDTNYADGIQWQGTLAPGELKILKITFQAQGTAGFSYALGRRKTEIKRLKAVLSTDFDDITVPEGALVPGSRGTDAGRTRMEWSGTNMVTGQNIALRFNIQGNYGETVSRMFFYAPLSLLLFIGFLVVYYAAREIRLHPMNHLFIITAFFIFYLLGSYVISYLPVIAAVFTALTVSTAILLYYAHLIRKDRVFLTAILFGALIFQWIFSIAFFFPEHTGFLVTVASIIAFIALMRATAAVDWEHKW